MASSSSLLISSPFLYSFWLSVGLPKTARRMTTRRHPTTSGRRPCCRFLIVVAVIVAILCRVVAAIAIVGRCLIDSLGRRNLLAQFLHGNIRIRRSDASIQIARILLVVFGPGGIYPDLRLGENVRVSSAGRFQNAARWTSSSRATNIQFSWSHLLKRIRNFNRI